MKKLISLILCAAVIFGACAFSASAEEYDHTPPEPTLTGFAESDGVNVEYAVYGSLDRRPMVLFSPNNGSMHSFDWELVPEFSKRFMVITFSTRGTGNTPLGDKKLTFEQDCRDVNAVLEKLGVKSFYVYGFSDGGNLGLVYTLKNPERVERLAVKSANINTRGTKFISQFKIEWRYFRLGVEYFFTHDPETLRRRMITGKMVGQPSLEFEDLAAISCPVLNIFGEHDMFYRRHSQGITKAIPGAKELMIKGSGHGCTEEEVNNVLLPALLEFFA